MPLDPGAIPARLRATPAPAMILRSIDEEPGTALAFSQQGKLGTLEQPQG
jgi:hypothetical protein